MASAQGGSRLGTRFGPYELHSLIGVGGMGEVYRAYDTVRERTVAVKLLRAEMAADASYQERFRRESRLAARLQEPHVIPVHDFGDIGGTLYIDMRLVEGASLKDELRANGPLEPARAASIITQVAAALDAAHADGLIHRDIKPENVLLTPDDFAYLVDFGIAHGDGDASVTSTGLIIGSCAYMAAERFAGGQVGPAADIYSLTCLLYECLTGRAPFENSGDLRQLMSAHMFSPPPRPSIMRRGITRAFDDVIARGHGQEARGQVLLGGRTGQGGDRGGRRGRAVAAGASAAESAVEHAAVLGDLRESGGDGLHAVPAAGSGAPKAAGAEEALRPDAGGVGGGDGRAVRRGCGPCVGIGLRRPRQHRQPRAAWLRRRAVTTTDRYDDRSPTTTSTTPTTSTSSAPLAGMTGLDGQGFVGHTARCDPGSSPVAAIQTALSMAVVCETAPGSYEYRGERLRDGANIQLANAVPAGGGFDVANPADGARYEVRPDRLRILSDGGVDSDEPALQYGSR